MKSVKTSTGTSKRSRGEATTTAPISGAMSAIEETFMDPITAMDPSSVAEDVDPTVTPPLSLCATMESFMTTQAAHRQLLDELLIEVASLQADFAAHRQCLCS